MPWSAYGFAGDVYVFVSGDHPPTSHEWNAYLADFARFGDQPVGILVLVDTGLPDVVQKASITQFFDDAAFVHPASVVSNDETVRETVEVFQWLGHRIQFFLPEAIIEAMEFAGVRRSRVSAVWSLARELERSIEGGRVDAIARADPYIRMAQEPALPEAVNRTC